MSEKCQMVLSDDHGAGGLSEFVCQQHTDHYFIAAYNGQRMSEK